MKGLLFLGCLILILFVASYGLNKKEGFSNINEGTIGVVNLPSPLPKTEIANLSSPGPYFPPADKTYGPAYGDISRIGTLPYKDPALEAATLKRLAELLESLKGFMAFEAKGLQDLSDPSVQLPLTSLRGDIQRLTDEVSVLKRNPGMGSAITQGQADDIQANLAYLQRKFRTSVNSESGSEEKEGFEDVSDKTVSPRVSLKDLKEIRTKILVETARLSSSGTTDPTVQARLNTLGSIHNSLESLINNVSNGTQPESEIPVLKSDMDKFLPNMSDPSQPLPQLLNTANLPPSLANLFPGTGSDATGAKISQTLFANYGDALFKGLSWGLDLKFISPNELELAKTTNQSDIVNTTNTVDTTAYIKNPTTGQQFDFKDGGTPTRGEMESATNPNKTTSGEPARFNWKERSSTICDSIRKAGYNPANFGCMKTSTTVSNDYSWRGYARMICTRLQTTVDPGLPEICGCPPIEWAGWRS